MLKEFLRIITNSQQQQQQQQVKLAYLKLGYTQLYMRYFNEALLLLESSSSSVDEKDEVRATILKEATELHNTFCMVHKSCTEHISLLHLCYELSATATAVKSMEIIIVIIAVMIKVLVKISYHPQNMIMRNFMLLVHQ
jgi:hypothetical protein